MKNGLTDAVSDEEITDSVSKYKKGEFAFDDLSKFLADQAIAQGTGDNVTVMCCQYKPDKDHEILDTDLTTKYPAEIAKIIKYFKKEFPNG